MHSDTISKPFFLSLLFLPTLSFANYCIQVSSVNKIDKVYILKQAYNKTLQLEDNIRVEKIGNFYTLRVGDFSSKTDAKISLKRIHPNFKDAFIRKCIKHPKQVIYSSEKKVFTKSDKDSKKEDILCDTMLPPNYENTDFNIK